MAAADWEEQAAGALPPGGAAAADWAVQAAGALLPAGTAAADWAEQAAGALLLFCSARACPAFPLSCSARAYQAFPLSCSARAYPAFPLSCSAQAYPALPVFRSMRVRQQDGLPVYPSLAASDRTLPARTRLAFCWRRNPDGTAHRNGSDDSDPRYSLLLFRFSGRYCLPQGE